MDSSSQKGEGKKKIAEITTFPVQFGLEGVFVLIVRFSLFSPNAKGTLNVVTS